MIKQVLEVDQTTLEESIRNVLEGVVGETLLSKFYNRFVSAETVAEIHGVHYMTVMNHIKAGNIPVQDGRMPKEAYRIRLSEALKLDFEALRKRK